MKITKVSPFTGIERTMDLDIDQSHLDRIANRYKTGELIQNIVPHLSAEEREFLISGLVPSEWNKLFCKEESEN